MPDMNYSKSFRVKPGTTVNLGRVDPNFSDKHESESSAEAEIAEYQEKLRDLQYLMYAEDKRALLICLQQWTLEAKTEPLGMSWGR
jgi:hypothetical protein